MPSRRLGASMQMVMSMVGSSVRSSLQEKQTEIGNDGVQNLVNQFGKLTFRVLIEQMEAINSKMDAFL